MDDHEEVSCDDDGGTVVAYLKVVWNSNGREEALFQKGNCSMDIFFSQSAS